MIKTSEKTTELFKALAQFQQDVKQPKKDANNPFFKSKYVPLENVVDVIHEAGAPLGLYEATYPVQEGGLVGVGVIITHSSGQFIEFPPIMLKPSKNDPQGYGAAMTYARRYALSAAFGIASETDDDANSISPQNQPKPKKVSKTQVSALKAVLKSIAELTNQTEAQATKALLAHQGLPSKLDQLNENEYGTFLRYLNKLKQTYEKKVKEEEVEQESLLEGNTTTAKK